MKATTVAFLLGRLFLGGLLFAVFFSAVFFSVAFLSAIFFSAGFCSAGSSSAGSSSSTASSSAAALFLASGFGLSAAAFFSFTFLAFCGLSMVAETSRTAVTFAGTPWGTAALLRPTSLAFSPTVCNCAAMAGVISRLSECHTTGLLMLRRISSGLDSLTGSPLNFRTRLSFFSLAYFTTTALMRW